jgi:drug/metabolite transporter (DMT)-like permease
MNILTLSIVISASLAYVILIKQALRKNQKEEEKISFSSFLLWSIIDLIMLVNTIRAKNDYILITTYTVLTILLTLVLFFKKQFKWSKSDTLVAGIACICLVVSYVSSPIVGVTCGALSIASAGIPNLINISKQQANKMLYWTIFFFFLAPLLSCVDVFIKNGTLKDYIYPCIAMGYWGIAFGISLLRTRHS